jgi:hypothetical protein
MDGLIPLKLRPTLAANVNPSTPPTSRLPPPIPVKSPRRVKSEMSLSFPFPNTRAVLDEVRATYLKGQYKQCSARCIQLLECSPDTVRQFRVTFVSNIQNIMLGSHIFGYHLFLVNLYNHFSSEVIQHSSNSSNSPLLCIAFTSHSMLPHASN